MNVAPAQIKQNCTNTSLGSVAIAIINYAFHPYVYAKHSTMFVDQLTYSSQLGLVSTAKRAQGLIKFKFGTLPCSQDSLRGTSTPILLTLDQ